MNFKHIKTLIAFLLVTAIAQPMQAATYKDRAKKVARYAWHASKIASGTALSLLLTHALLKTVNDLREQDRNLITDINFTNVAVLAISSLTTIKSGYDGLKAEWAENQI